MRDSGHIEEVQPIAVVVLAAGKGKRMNNPAKAKVMFEAGGTPLIGHVLQRVSRLQPSRVIVVTGHQREEVEAYCSSAFPETEFVVQLEQLGTGHAVLQAEPKLKEFPGDVLILAGDVPLLNPVTLAEFYREHYRYRAINAASVLTVEMENPFGYGRIVRDEDGCFTAIVEERDADDRTKAIKEINTGIFLVRAGHLFSALHEIGNANAQKEYYLTDLVRVMRDHRMSVNAIKADDPFEFLGVNTPEDLARVEGILRQ